MIALHRLKEKRNEIRDLVAYEGFFEDKKGNLYIRSWSGDIISITEDASPETEDYEDVLKGAPLYAVDVVITVEN